MTLIFDLGGHGPLVADAGLRVPLKFVGLPIRKILRIYCVNISRPGDLDLTFDL